MKDSGIEWIGEIPDGWELCKGKALYNIATGKLDANAGSPKGLYPFFTCSMQPKSINSYAFDCEALLVAGNGIVGFTQYYKGKFNAYQRTYVLSEFRNVTPSFLKHYVSICLPIEVEPNSVGSVIQFIKLGDLKNFSIVLPKLQEQQSISEFLDNKCAKIDKLIAHEETTIEELKAYKQSVIAEAVTKGLDKSAPMRDSGIEWIGKIPESWNVSKIKMLADFNQENSFMDGDWIESPYIEDEGIRYITTGNIGDGMFKRQGNGFISNATFEKLQCKYAYPGDLIFSRLNEEYGRSCILPDDYEKYVIAVDNVILRTKEEKRYICYATQCTNYHTAVFFLARGTAMKRISRTNLGNVSVPLPTIQEQKQIADYLDKKCADINGLISIKQQKIEELKEYKKSLIYEYVTGKKEVV